MKVGSQVRVIAAPHRKRIASFKNARSETSEFFEPSSVSQLLFPESFASVKRAFSKEIEHNNSADTVPALPCNNSDNNLP